MQISRFSEVSCRKPPDAPYCLYRSLSETCKEEEDGPGRKDTDLGFQSLCTTSCVTPTDHLLWNSSSKVPLPPFNGKDCCWESEVPGFSFWTHPLSRKGKRESEFAKELALLSSIQVSALGCEAYAFVEVVRSKLLILPACFARLVIFKKFFFLQTRVFWWSWHPKRQADFCSASAEMQAMQQRGLGLCLCEYIQ